MADPEKRKLSAKEIVADIRSGMDGSELKRKYGLSDKGLESACRKLSDKGLLSEQELDRLKPSSPAPAVVPHTASTPQWRCPACQAVHPSEMSECPACGVVVAKFLARGGQGFSDARSLRIVGQDVSTGGSGWTYVIVSVVALALVGGAVVWWSTHRSSKKAEIAALTAQRYQSSQQGRVAPEVKAPEDQTTSIDLPETGAESAPAVTYDAGPLEPPQRPAGGSADYTTGVLRQFTSADFKREVVEASKTYPVLFQFYSDT